jgi:polyferredoxin
MERFRRFVQFISAFIANSRLWITPSNPIYTGPLKQICFPGLNCYSCPAAISSCPLGALQNVMASLKMNLQLGKPGLGLYIIGSLGMMGAVVGRAPCAWFCPFGLFQDILYKLIRVPKLPFWRPLSYGRYVFLFLFVIILPVFVLDAAGFGQTWFCKFVCPAGTLEAGLPLLALDSGLRSAVGALVIRKLTVLVLFIIWSIVNHRPFCRAVCPLGLIFGFFNRISWLQLRFNKDICVECYACEMICPTGVSFADGRDDINSTKCIRCMRCFNLCPGGAITVEFSKTRRSAGHEGCACHKEQG